MKRQDLARNLGKLFLALVALTVVLLAAVVGDARTGTLPRTAEAASGELRTEPPLPSSVLRTAWLVAR